MRVYPTGPSNTVVLRLPMWRSRLVLFIMFIGFFALLGRAFWVQGPGNDFYAQKGKRVERVIALPSVRGKILDRNGEILATSLEAKTIIAYPDTIPDDLPAAKVSAFAKLLKMNEMSATHETLPKSTEQEERKSSQAAPLRADEMGVLTQQVEGGDSNQQQ